MVRRTMTVGAFANHLPVRIRFGDGVAATLADVLEQDGSRQAFVVLDEGLEQLVAPVGAALAAVDARGIDVVRFTRAPGEPLASAVQEAADALAAAGADAVVAVGGGSVMDTAKVARVCAGEGMTVESLLDDRPPIPPPDVPLICLPTTAGTGSEVSGGAVMTDGRTGEKSGIASPELRAQHALVDPVLTHGLPASVTAWAGVDALAQAVAGIVATTRTPIGDAIALEATRLVARSLVPAVREGAANPSARADMACASLMAGLTMNISDCAAEHSLAQAIGGRFHLPHGLTVGLVLAETLERERRHVPEHLERVADALGVSEDGSGDGSRAVRGVARLLAQLDFPVLRDVGVGEEHVEELTQRALADFFITRSPVPWSAEEVGTALRSALAIERRS